MRTLSGDTGAIAVSHALSAGVQLALQVLIVRVTTPVDFGRYVAALAFVTIVEAVVVSRGGELALQFVGNAWVEKRFADARRAASRVLRQDALLQTIAFFILVAGAWALASIYPLDIWLVSGLALVIPAQIGYGVHKSVFIASGRLKEQAAFEAVTVLVQSSLVATGVLMVGIEGVVVGQVLGTGLKNLMARQWTRRWWPSVEAQEPDSDGPIASWRWFTVLSVIRNTFAHASNQVDIIILNGTGSANAVAVYKVARTLAALPTRVTQPFWVALRPSLMEALAQRRAEWIRRLVGLPALVMLGALAVGVWPIAEFGDDVIAKVYGSAYAAAGTPLVVLTVGAWVFGAVTGWLGFWVVVSEERRAGTATFGLLLGLMVLTGTLYGRGSPIRMAVAVATSMVVASAFGWLLLARSLERLRRASAGS